MNVRRLGSQLIRNVSVLKCLTQTLLHVILNVKANCELFNFLLFNKFWKGYCFDITLIRYVLYAVTFRKCAVGFGGS